MWSPSKDQNQFEFGEKIQQLLCQQRNIEALCSDLSKQLEEGLIQTKTSEISYFNFFILLLGKFIEFMTMTIIDATGSCFFT